MGERYHVLANKGRRHLYTYILMAYFMLAPFEDLLSFRGGTVGKWLALLIVLSGLYELGGRLELKFKEGNLAMMYLMLLGLVSCVWAIYPEVALARNAAYLTLPGFCLFVSALDFSKKEYEDVVKAAVLGGVLVSVYVLINGNVASSGRLRLDEGNDPNNLAALLQLPMAMAFRQAMRKQTKNRLLYLLGFLLILFVLLMTGSRGGMVSAAVFLLAFFLFSKAYKKAGVLLGILIIGFLIWQFLLPALPEAISSRLFETNYNREIINGNRVRIWRAVIAGVLPQMPAYGVGAGCAPYALMEWFRSVKGVHNTYLCMLCEYGVLGIGFFLMFLFTKLKTQLILHHYAEVALMLAIYVTIFFLDSYAKKFFWNVMVLAVIAAKAEQCRCKRTTHGSKQEF